MLHTCVGYIISICLNEPVYDHARSHTLPPPESRESNNSLASNNVYSDSSTNSEHYISSRYAEY